MLHSQRFFSKLLGMFFQPALPKLAIVSLLLATPTLHAQNTAPTGRIVVEITDLENRPIENARVEITARDGTALNAANNGNSQNTNLIRSTALLPGIYDVVVAAEGYRSVRSPSVRVSGRKATRLDIAMLPSSGLSIEETVVLGTTVGVDTTGSVGNASLNREALRSAAGSGGDVLRALDGLPGLFSSGEFSSFTVRGNGPRDNLILVDNIPFDNVVHFDQSFGELEDVEGGGRFSVFAPNLIGSAEFQPGGWNAAYGGRSGSLLKLDVAEGNQDSASYNLRLDLAGLEIGYDGPSYLHDDTSILFSARQLDFGQLFDVIGVEDIGAPKLTDIIFKSHSQVSSRDEVNFLVIYAPEEFSRDIDNVLASDEDGTGDFDDADLVEAEADNLLLALSWSRLIGEASTWDNRIYLRQFDESVVTGEALLDAVGINTPASSIPVRDSILSSTREEGEFGWRSDYNRDNLLGTFQAGVLLRHIDLSFSLALDDDFIVHIFDQDDFRPDPTQNFIVLTPDTINNRFETEYTSFSAYTDQTFEYNNWHFRAGLRFDNDGLTEEALFSPRIGGGWKISNRMRVSATAGVYYQTPRFEDLANDVSNDLENERINQVSIGFKYRLNDNLDLFVESYYQDLDNLVVEGDAVTKSASNSGSGFSYGLDTALTRNFKNGWSASMNYSFNEARIRDSASSQEYDADFNRPHALSIGGAWEINNRWQISSRFKWASGTPRDEFIIHENVFGDGEPLRFSKEIIATNTDRFDGFSSVNLRVDYRRSLLNADLITFIDIINVLASSNPSSADFSERTGADVIDEGESFPLLGIRLEW